MTKTNKAPVSVVMPEVKLAVADLAFMTGLLPGATRCHGGSKVTDKLVFLGLIEMADIPPCPKALAQIEKDRKAWKVGIREAVKAGKWSLIESMPYRLREGKEPRAGRDFVLTKFGREFMATGRTSAVTSMKAGCVK